MCWHFMTKIKGIAKKANKKRPKPCSRFWVRLIRRTFALLARRLFYYKTHKGIQIQKIRAYEYEYELHSLRQLMLLPWLLLSLLLFLLPAAIVECTYEAVNIFMPGYEYVKTFIVLKTLENGQHWALQMRNMPCHIHMRTSCLFQYQLY